jgi:hypothetical protein
VGIAFNKPKGRHNVTAGPKPHKLAKFIFARPSLEGYFSSSRELRMGGKRKGKYREGVLHDGERLTGATADRQRSWLLDVRSMEGLGITCH